MGYESFEFKKDVTIKLKYLVYLPQSHDKNKKWPLILSLHGSGERWDNLDKVKRWGIHKILRENNDSPFIVVSPQCPSGEIWEMQFNALKDILVDVEKDYNIDKERIYLTGYSLGGMAHGILQFLIQKNLQL